MFASHCPLDFLLKNLSEGYEDDARTRAIANDLARDMEALTMTPAGAVPSRASVISRANGSGRRDVSQRAVLAESDDGAGPVGSGSRSNAFAQRSQELGKPVGQTLASRQPRAFSAALSNGANDDVVSISTGAAGARAPRPPRRGAVPQRTGQRASSGRQTPVGSPSASTAGDGDGGDDYTGLEQDALRSARPASEAGDDVASAGVGDATRTKQRPLSEVAAVKPRVRTSPLRGAPRTGVLDLSSGTLVNTTTAHAQVLGLREAGLAAAASSLAKAYLAGLAGLPKPGETAVGGGNNGDVPDAPPVTEGGFDGVALVGRGDVPVDGKHFSGLPASRGGSFSSFAPAPPPAQQHQQQWQRSWPTPGLAGGPTPGADATSVAGASGGLPFSPMLPRAINFTFTPVRARTLASAHPDSVSGAQRLGRGQGLGQGAAQPIHETPVPLRGVGGSRPVTPGTGAAEDEESAQQPLRSWTEMEALHESGGRWLEEAEAADRSEEGQRERLDQCARAVGRAWQAGLVGLDKAFALSGLQLREEGKGERKDGSEEADDERRGDGGGGDAGSEAEADAMLQLRRDVSIVLGGHTTFEALAEAADDGASAAEGMHPHRAGGAGGAAAPYSDDLRSSPDALAAAAAALGNVRQAAGERQAAPREGESLRSARMRAYARVVRKMLRALLPNDVAADVVPASAVAAAAAAAIAAADEAGQRANAAAIRAHLDAARVVADEKTGSGSGRQGSRSLVTLPTDRVSRSGSSTSSVVSSSPLMNASAAATESQIRAASWLPRVSGSASGSVAPPQLAWTSMASVLGTMPGPALRLPSALPQGMPTFGAGWAVTASHADVVAAAAEAAAAAASRNPLESVRLERAALLSALAVAEDDAAVAQAAGASDALASERRQSLGGHGRAAAGGSPLQLVADEPQSELMRAMLAPTERLAQVRFQRSICSASLTSFHSSAVLRSTCSTPTARTPGLPL